MIEVILLFMELMCSFGSSITIDNLHSIEKDIFSINAFATFHFLGQEFRICFHFGSIVNENMFSNILSFY